MELRGLDSSEYLIRVRPEQINPFAVGHLINHPPADTPANCKLLDFDIPYSFFPSYMARYVPIMDRCDRTPHSPFASVKKENATRRSDSLRAIAVVSMQSIGDGEELFCDYLEDRRANINYAPDWLLRPPRLSALLEKKKMTTYVPAAVKILLAWEQAK